MAGGVGRTLTAGMGHGAGSVGVGGGNEAIEMVSEAVTTTQV